MSTNLAPRCGARAIWKSKSLKTGGLGVFRGSKCFPWQAQGFRDVAKYEAGAGVPQGCKNVRVRGGFEEVRFDAFRVAGAGISGFAKPTFEASGAESVEELQISSHGSVTLQGSFRVAITGVRMPRLNFHFKIAKTYCNSEVKRLVTMSFLKEVSQKRFVFELQSFMFEGRLAEKHRF